MISLGADMQCNVPVTKTIICLLFCQLAKNRQLHIKFKFFCSGCICQYNLIPKSYVFVLPNVRPPDPSPPPEVFFLFENENLQMNRNFFCSAFLCLLACLTTIFDPAGQKVVRVVEVRVQTFNHGHTSRIQIA